MSGRIFLALSILPALHAASIYAVGECPNSASSATTATLILQGAGCSASGAITASQSVFNTAISLNVNATQLNLFAVANSDPDMTVVMGGSGLGYIDITYTDTIHLSGLWEGESESGHAGSLTFNTYCFTECAGINETMTYSTGPIAVTAGEQIPLNLSVNLQASLWQGGLQGTVSESASVAIVRVFAAEPEVAPVTVPEPSAFWPGMVLLAAAAVRMATRKADEV
jgi:hypothetical protein